MKKIFFIFFILCAARAGQASEIRTESMGGLSLAVWDEESQVTPYAIGNPAGLALLEPQTRIEFTVPWYQTTSQGNLAQWNMLGLGSHLPYVFPSLSAALSPLNDTADLGYQGVLYAAPDHWAFQVAGGVNNETYEYENFGPDQIQFANDEALLRGAGQWGALSFGTEIQFSQWGATDNGSTPGFKPTLNQIQSNTGALVRLSLGEGKQPAVLLLGGAFSFAALPTQITGNPGAYTGNVFPQLSYSLQPCAFLEIPGRFQGGVVADFRQNTPLTFDSATPEYYVQTQNRQFDLAVLYKARFPLSGADSPKPMNLTQGALFQLTAQSGNLVGSPFSYNSSENGFQVAVGLEREGDFAAGLQGNLYGYSESPNSSSLGFSNLQLSLGGEFDLAPEWAARAGLMWGSANVPATSPPHWEGLYYDYPGQTVQGVMPSLGLGYQGKTLRVDGMVWFEQPSSPSVAGAPFMNYTVVGAGLTAELYWGG